MEMVETVDSKPFRTTGSGEATEQLQLLEKCSQDGKKLV